MIETTLPDRAAVGTAGTWAITDNYGDTITVTGELLGLGSSHRARHMGHAPGEFAPQRTHCSTCRWTEIRIFISDDDSPQRGEYLVINRGASIVPGERDLIEHEWLRTAHEVLEKMTTRRGSDVFLTAPASRALAQAAEYDAGMRDAYINRAVK